MKKITALVLAVTLLTAMCIPVSAAENNAQPFYINTNQAIEESSCSSIAHEVAVTLSEKHSLECYSPAVLCSCAYPDPSEGLVYP